MIDVTDLASDLIPPAWKWAAAAVLTLGLLALFTWQHLEIGRLEADLKTEKAAARKCEAERGVLTVQVAAWKQSAAARAEQAERALAAAAKTREAAEARARTLYRLTQPITQDQFDALVSLAYNIGGGAYCGSTLVRRLNAGDCHAAAAEFERWIRVQGRVVPGLVARRAAERKRFQAHCGAAT